MTTGAYKIMRRWMLLAATALVLAGCGGGGQTDSSDEESSAPTSASATTSEAPPRGAQNYDTVADLYAAVTSAGVACGPLTEDPDPTPARARGRCTAASGDLVFYLWADQQDKVDGVGLVQGSEGSSWCWLVGRGTGDQGAWSVDATNAPEECELVIHSLPGLPQQYTAPVPSLSQVKQMVGTPCTQPGQVTTPDPATISPSTPSYGIGPAVGPRGVICFNGVWAIVADPTGTTQFGCGSYDSYPYATPDARPLFCIDGTLFLDGETRQVLNAGTYRVGTETGFVAPGTYAATNVDGCYWERLDSTGEIIDNNFINAAPRAEFTVRASDYAINIDGCGGFKRV